MRVLLVSQYYDPEPVEKVHDLARGLARLGMEVRVLTGFPSYPRGRIFPGYRQRLWSDEVIDGVAVTRVPIYPDHSSSAIRRILYYTSFMLSASILGMFRQFRPDVVLVYQAALPVGLAGWLLAKLARAPLVLDVVDLWPESVTSTGMLKSRSAEKVIRAVARWIYRRATKINVVTHGFRSNLLGMGVPDHKLSVIHNWMPSDTYRTLARDPETGDREGLVRGFNVMYAGNMGAPQALGTVLDAALLLKDEPSVQFALVGDGVDFESLKERTLAENITNVRFLGRRPPDQMPSLYAWADVLLVHLKPDLLTEISIPSKTFAYMAVGKPILMAVQGDAADLVNEERIGCVVEPCRPAQLAAAVRELARKEPSQLESIGRHAAAVHAEKYSGEVQIRRFAELLSDVVEAHE